MARKSVTQQLREDLAYETKRSNQKDGKIEELNAQIEKHEKKSREFMSLIREIHAERRSEFDWMRSVVELMVVPKEKFDELEVLRKRRDEQRMRLQMNGSRDYPDILR